MSDIQKELLNLRDRLGKKVVTENEVEKLAALEAYVESKLAPKAK